MWDTFKKLSFRKMPQREMIVFRVIESVDCDISVEEQALGNIEQCLLFPYNSLNNQILLRAVKSIKSIQSRENLVKIIKRLSLWLESHPVENDLRICINKINETITPCILKTAIEIQGVKNILIHIMMQAFPGHHQYINQRNIQFYLLYFKQSTCQKIIISDFKSKDKNELWGELNSRLRFETEYASDLHSDYFSKTLLILAEYVKGYTQSFYKMPFVGQLPLRGNIEFICELYNDIVDALNAADESEAKSQLKVKIGKKLQTFNLVKRMEGKLRLDFEHLDREQQKSREECFSEVSIVYADYVQKLETEVEKARHANNNLSREINNLNAQISFQTAYGLASSENSKLNLDQPIASLLPIPTRDLNNENDTSLTFVKTLACLIKSQEQDQIVRGECIHHGVYSDVYKGVYNNQHQVAIKVMTHAYAYECKNEITYLGNLKSEHVLKLKGFIIKATGDHLVSPIYYIITDYMVNGSLYDFLKNDRGINLPLFSKLQLARGILKGLIYLHQQNVIHADLKSPNILINENIVPILSDFGSAVPKGAITTVRGTPGWMALELLKIFSDPSAECLFTEAIDMYAFGIILYEILYHDYSYNRSRVEILQNPYPMIPPGAHQQIKNLMTLCWSVDPGQRPTGTYADSLIQTASQAQNAYIVTPTSTRSFN